MIHLDLFSGIGGFAYAADQVWENVEHIFCDNDKFCRQVLKKHWPNSKIYEDIRTITNTKSLRNKRNGGAMDETKEKPQKQDDGTEFKCGDSITLLTGGFPCQPFSQAGKRKGTDDDRYLWPEMLRVIQLANPQWVIAENVRGLLTQSGGLVFEQVCLDLEASGYEVQPFIIPAVAKNAPHRRDRAWFVAHRKCREVGNEYGLSRNERGNTSEVRRESIQHKNRKTQAMEFGQSNTNAQDPLCKRGSGRSKNGRQILERQSPESETARPSGENGDVADTNNGRLERASSKRQKPENVVWNSGKPDWNQNWLEVATELCRVDDGLSPELDFAGWSKARHRVERLKSLGNAIVPAVAVEIMKAISNY